MNTTDISTNTPRAWVGCLGCYNAGNLVGRWLDADQCGDMVSARLANAPKPEDQEIYGNAPRCIKCGAEEFWVFDHENFHGLLRGECAPHEAFEASEKLAQVLEDDLPMLDSWMSEGNDFDPEAMQDAYAGRFESFTDFAEDFAEQTDMLVEIPEDLRRYFDFEAFGRDLQADYWEVEGYFFRRS